MTEFETQLLIRLDSISTALATLCNGNALSFVSEFTPAISQCKYTFGEWLIHWQEKYKRLKQSEKTYNSNIQIISNKIIPNLGNIKLVDLTGDTIQDFINGLPVSNNRDKLALILKSSLQKALDLGHILRNPYKAVEIQKSKPKSYPVLQPYHQLRILRKIDSEKYKRMFLFYCCTGFRLSEGLSINPQKDIDFEQNVINLDLPDQSTKKHKRTIPYLPKLLESFDLSKTTLFPNITESSAKQYFRKLFKRYEINACFHSFRHTFISCCYHVGIPPKQIQEWAGHKSIVMTMDTYTHILNGKNTPILDYLKDLKKTLKI